MNAKQYLASQDHVDLYEILGLPDPLAYPDSCIKGTYQSDPRYVLAEGEEPIVRWRVEGMPPAEMGDQQKALIDRLSSLLGMVDGFRPAFGDFAGAAFLGAARKAPVQRLEHLLKAIQSGKATVGWLGGVGSGRILDEKERGIVDFYARFALTESDLNAAAWAFLAPSYPDIEAIELIKVPSPRARNMDVMRAVMNRLREEYRLHDEATVAFSTNRIYEAFTSAEAAMVQLEYPGTFITVVTCAADEAAKQARNHNTYKSEILRTDRAYVESIKLGLDPILPEPA